MLARRADIDVVAEAADGREGVTRALHLRPASREGIERAVRSAAAGHTVLSGEVAARVTRAATTGRPRPGGDAFPALTDRELELLDLLAAGLDNGAMAQKLHLAPKTIRNQVSALLDKLGVADRADAIRLGRDASLGRGSLMTRSNR